MPTDLETINNILAGYPQQESSLVMVLQDIQEALRYLPEAALERVSEYLDIPRARVFSVATFYKVFSLTPQGRTLVQVCKGTACHVRGAQLIEDEMCKELSIKVGEASEDLSFSVKTVNCVGACAMAPVVVVGEKYHGKVKATQTKKLLGKRDAQK